MVNVFFSACQLFIQRSRLASDYKQLGGERNQRGMKDSRRKESVCHGVAPLVSYISLVESIDRVDWINPGLEVYKFHSRE